MTVAPAPERAFITFPRGEVREDVLISFRTSLRQLVNPETALPFTETEIATATGQLSRWWREADAVDLVLLSGQARALFFADQVRPDRAASPWLRNYHGELWQQVPLFATGGSGATSAPCNASTTFVGSTTIPDPAASFARDPSGKRYQVLYTVTSSPSGANAAVILKGVDTGEDTNIPAGTELTWGNGPLGNTGPAVVVGNFTGGTADETDAQFASRLLARIRHKPASGNSAHFRVWARDSSNAVDTAFVYACAMQAGTVLVCITQKRSTVKGPAGRLPSALTLADAIAYLTPPGSPVVPTPPHVLLVGPVPEPSDMVMRLGMPLGQSTGWADLQPWPGSALTLPTTITNITTATQFDITIPTGSPPLPGPRPALMVWDDALSRFEKLNLDGDVVGASPTYTVTVSPTSKVLAIGDYICPDTSRRDLIAETVEEYFDTLGTGEVVDIVNDPRGHRAFRFPKPAEEFPQRAGSSVLNNLTDALGSGLGDSSFEDASVVLPSIPADPTLGPSLIVAGKIGIYPL